LRCTINVYKLPDLQKQLVLELIREKKNYNEIDEKITNALIKKGVIIRRGDTLQFSSRLIQRIIFNQLCSPLERPSTAPEDPVKLMLQCLPLFDGEWLTEKLWKKK